MRHVVHHQTDGHDQLFVAMWAQGTANAASARRERIHLTSRPTKQATIGSTPWRTQGTAQSWPVDSLGDRRGIWHASVNTNGFGFWGIVSNSLAAAVSHLEPACLGVALRAEIIVCA